MDKVQAVKGWFFRKYHSSVLIYCKALITLFYEEELPNAALTIIPHDYFEKNKQLLFSNDIKFRDDFLALLTEEKEVLLQKEAQVCKLFKRLPFLLLDQKVLEEVVAPYTLEKRIDFFECANARHDALLECLREISIDFYEKNARDPEGEVLN